MILGVDLGNYSIKTSEYISFPSKITTEQKIMCSLPTLTFATQTYTLGDGEFQTDYSKTLKSNMLPTLFGAIALSSKEVHNKVVVGLPISHYHAEKENIKRRIMDNNSQNIVLGKDKRTIIITHVEVVPEGVAAFHSLSTSLLNEIGVRDVVIVDIGGRTTDICLYGIAGGSRRIQKYQTIMVGMLNIYDDLAQIINSRYVLGLEMEDGEKILREGLWLYGKPIDLTFVTPLLKKHWDKIDKELKLNFPVETSHILLTGGGGLMLKDSFEKRYPHVIVANEPIFGNAIGFKKVGEALWKV